MKLKQLSKSTSLKGKRILVRVDWNVPLPANASSGKARKITRTIPFLRELQKRGATVLIMTHLGRPKGREMKYSTKGLARAVKAYTDLPVEYLNVDLSTSGGAKAFKTDVDTLKPKSIVCLENVRFQPGEVQNDAKLAKRYADAADLYINDAFASCHRAHASVVGIGKSVPTYAGPGLVAEVTALHKLLQKPRKPYYAFIGGAKLSTKLPVIEQLLKIADKVFIGGAMAHPFFVAQKYGVGKSLMEPDGVKIAKKLLKNKKIVVPTDVIVGPKIAAGVTVRRAAVNGVKKTERIGDIGTETVMEWVDELNHAETIVWNGPFGVTELPAFSHGSLVIAKALAIRSKGRPYVVVGGGDTLPVVAKTGMDDLYDFVSTGGGAMLEFISKKGKLPGFVPLLKK
ncbi:phosphoglycerate kinase [Candidatus Uhrbacteria bacterium]|nr:phosphoglycerate kinase [Candidatus Uhrbacteria bacterium]MBD3283961.1 phosphoglycerate kinase [Candidatus Uhrbacteria bacterium]